MLGQEVQIDDRIACSFRTYYGTAPQLRVGVVVDIVDRKSSERTGLQGDARPIETHLKVRWTDSSDIVALNDGIRSLVDKGVANGISYSHAATNQQYRERTTEILVRLKRFIKIS